MQKSQKRHKFLVNLLMYVYGAGADTTETGAGETDMTDSDCKHGEADTNMGPVTLLIGLLRNWGTKHGAVL